MNWQSPVSKGMRCMKGSGKGLAITAVSLKRILAARMKKKKEADPSLRVSNS